MAESNKTNRPPGDVSTDLGPGDLEDLDAVDADVAGGGANGAGGGTGPNEIQRQ